MNVYQAFLWSLYVIFVLSFFWISDVSSVYKKYGNARWNVIPCHYHERYHYIEGYVFIAASLGFSSMRSQKQNRNWSWNTSILWADDRKSKEVKGKERYRDGAGREGGEEGLEYYVDRFQEEISLPSFQHFVRPGRVTTKALEESTISSFKL